MFDVQMKLNCFKTNTEFVCGTQFITMCGDELNPASYIKFNA